MSETEIQTHLVKENIVRSEKLQELIVLLQTQHGVMSTIMEQVCFTDTTPMLA